MSKLAKERTSSAVKLKKNVAESSHPDHTIHVKRLNRVRGQIDGIERMILEKRYCPEIITQLKAACAALTAVEAEIFKTHLRGCVKQAFSSPDEVGAERKINEIVKMVF